MREKEIITPYNSDSESKKGQVTRMFDNIAPYYDFLNRFLSLGIDKYWRKKAIQQLKGPSYPTALDMATGTADLAIEAHKHLNIDKVTGIDISENMLQLGRGKIINLNLTDRVVLEHGDSENIHYSDNHFDLVMSAYGVRNFENLSKGLSELYRVTKPGGKIMVLEFSRPRIFPLKQLFGIYFKFILPFIGKLKSKDPKAYQYLYESVQAFPDYHLFTDKLKEAGFKETSFTSLTGGICCVYLGTK